MINTYLLVGIELRSVSYLLLFWWRMSVDCYNRIQDYRKCAIVTGSINSNFYGTSPIRCSHHFHSSNHCHAYIKNYTHTCTHKSFTAAASVLSETIIGILLVVVAVVSAGCQLVALHTIRYHFSVVCKRARSAQLERNCIVLCRNQPQWIAGRFAFRVCVLPMIRDFSSVSRCANIDITHAWTHVISHDPEAFRSVCVSV